MDSSNLPTSVWSKINLRHVATVPNLLYSLPLKYPNIFISGKFYGFFFQFNFRTWTFKSIKYSGLNKFFLWYWVVNKKVFMACVKTTEKDIKGHRGKKELKWKEACFQLKWICWLIQKSGNFKENVDFFCLIFSFKIKTRTGVLTKCWLLQTTRNNVIAFSLLLSFPMSPCTCSCFCYLGEGSVHRYHLWEKKHSKNIRTPIMGR